MQLLVGHHRKPLEHVFEVGVRIHPVVPSALDDGVENRTAPTGVPAPYEKKVFPAKRHRTNGVFNPVVVNLHPSVFQADPHDAARKRPPFRSAIGA